MKDGGLIIAGVVTFEPELERLEENLTSITGQVSMVIVFDNGSSCQDDIENLVSRWSNATLVRSHLNVGVASALNRLAAEAVARGARAILTLDQDSVGSEDLVSVLETQLTAGVGIVTPYIVDRNKMTIAEYRALSLSPIETYRQAARKGAITSGSLVDLRAWRSVGGFDERFFIDYVDYDFNQRVMDAGWMVIRANRTWLLHEVGKATPTWLRIPRKGLDGKWRVERFFAFGHSPQRCYYKARNRVLFTRKYGHRLGLTHEGAWQIPLQILLTLMFENGRIEKLKCFGAGIRDGIRMPLDEPGPRG